MALATLSIDLEARLARFEADMGKAARLLDKLANNARQASTSIGAIFAGNVLASASIEGVRQLVDLFPRLIEGVAQYQTLAEQTGASATALASFQAAADLSGVSVETLAALTVKLTQNLSTVSDESKGAGQALRNLGIPLEEFRKLAPDEQIKRLSIAFNSFAEGAGKTSNALALFGKSGAQVLNFFQDYGDGARAVVRLTDEQIAAADGWTKAQAKANTELRQTAELIAVQALPALTLLKGVVREVGEDFIKAHTGAKSLTDDKAIVNWGYEVAIGIGTAVDSIDFLVRRAYLGVSTLGAAASAAKELFTPSFLRSGESRIENLQALWAAYAQDVTSTLSGQLKLADRITQRVNEARAIAAVPESLKDTRGIPGDTRPTLEGVQITSPAAADDAAKAKAAFQRFLQQITQKKELAQAELDTGDKLAESDRFRIDLLSQLSKAEDKLSASQIARVNAALDEALAVLKLNESRQGDLKARQAAAQIDARYQAAAERRIETIIGENKALEDQIEELGLTSRALEDLRLKRLLDARTEVIGDPAAGEREINLMDRRIAKFKELRAARDALAADSLAGAKAALNDYLEQVAAIGPATRDAARQGMGLLEDDLVNSLAKGKLDVTRFIDFTIAEFLRLQVVRPLLGRLFSSSGGGAGGGFGVGDNAVGNAYGASGIIPFAQGGIVNSPTLFRFSRGTGLMGEAGPEGILPLKRGRDGKLGVTAQGAGGVNITQNIVVQSGASRNEVMQASIEAKNAAIAEIQELMRRGSPRMQPA